MSEKRFTVMKKFDGSYVICDKGKMLVADDCCDLLNELAEEKEKLRFLIDINSVSERRKLERQVDEQQATIQELERKLKKYAKIGEEQLKQIIELQDELNECRARPTLATDERGVVKVEYRCR